VTPILPDLWRLLAPWRGYRYGALSHPDRRVDCSALVASVLRDAYGREVITPDVWRAVNLSVPGCGPWDGVQAVATALGSEASMPYAGPDQPVPYRLHYAQGWKSLGPGDTIQPRTPDRRGSEGHAWLWLSMGWWSGVAVESSGTGPRVWDGSGRRPLSDVVDAGGRLVGGLQPLDWSARAQPWTDGVAWTVLP